MTPRGEKIRETFRKKYGVDHPSQLSSVKEKIQKKRESGAYANVGRKMKQTLKEKYGRENYVNVDKCKKTKLSRYGDENYNNRDKMLKTNQEKYGSKVSPNVAISTGNRARSGEIGFKSEAYQSYLEKNQVVNASQLPDVSLKKHNKSLQNAIYKLFFGNRLNNVVVPMFSEQDYSGSNYDKLYKFKCTKCNNEFYDNLYSGNIPRCLECYPHNRFHSKIEDEVYEFIKELGETEIVRHDRSFLEGEEIDIVSQKLSIGIECDGIIWHSEVFGNKDKQYHLHKTSMLEDRGIRLIHLWDWEWISKKDILKSLITNLIGKTSNKIYARKCEIKEILPKDKSSFLEKNHIQGDDQSSVRLGLLHDGEIVSVMTFSKSRFDKKYEYELSRFCNSINTIIVGAASKLFSYFIKNYNPKSIVSYSDRRFFTGKVYRNIGMSFVEYTPPNYWYFHKNNCVPINRIKFQKHKLKGILNSFDPSLTEWQNMQNNGYDRIWDCGNLKYEWISS